MVIGYYTLLCEGVIWVSFIMFDSDDGLKKRILKQAFDITDFDLARLERTFGDCTFHDGRPVLFCSIAAANARCK